MGIIEELADGLEARMKNIRNKKLVAVIVLAAFIGVLLMKFPVWRYFMAQPYEMSFGKETLKELAYSGALTDRRAAREVLVEAEEAFSAIWLSFEKAEDKFGRLAKYTYTSDSYPDAVKEKHKLKLYTAKYEGKSGYLWICFTQEAYDSKGKLISGAWDNLARWEIKKDGNGAWHVSSIMEAV